MKRYGPLVARILLGLVFFVFGLNFFFKFITQPPMPPGAGAFAMAMGATGYMWQLLKVIEVVCGALLLADLFVPLALALLAPIVVNIVAFHLFLAPAGLAVPLVVLALEVYLAWSYRGAFRPMLGRKVPVTPA